MQHRQNVAQKPNGDIVAGASVTVTTYPAGVAAVLYYDNGITPIPGGNVVSTDLYGNYSYYIANGRYTETIVGTGLTTQTLQDIVLADPASPTINGGTIDGAVIGGTTPSTVNATSVTVTGGLATGTGAASANTAALQAALDVGGLVQITKPGTYYTNNSLVLKSNTCFKLSKGVVIKLLTGIVKNMIVNYATTIVRTTISSMTASGSTVTVNTATNHGYSIGSMVAIHGAGQSGYNGVYRVLSVGTPTQFSYKTEIIPTSTTATVSSQQIVMTTVVADENIKVEGGVFDYNVNNFAASSGTFNGNVIFLAHLINYSVSDSQLENAGTRCVWVSNARNGVISKIRTDVTRVCIQTNGAIHGLSIKDIESIGSDDGIAIMAKEQTLYTDVQYSEGDVVGVSIDRCKVSHDTAGIAIYNGGGGTHTVTGVKISNINGNSGNTVQVLGSSGQLMNANDITIDGLEGIASNYGILILYATLTSILASNINVTTGDAAIVISNATIELISIDGLKYKPLVSTQTPSPITMGTGAVVHRLTARRLITDGTWSPSAGTYAVAFATTCPANWSLADSHINSGVNVIAVAMGSSGKTGTISNTVAEGSSRLFFTSSSGTLDILNINNCRVIDSTNSISIASNLTISFSGYSTIGGTNAMQISAGTVTIIGSGFVFNGMNPLSTSGTPTIYIKSLEFPIDIGATGITKLAGLVAFNTSARGTILANRHVTCNGTNWVQIDTPANTF